MAHASAREVTPGEVQELFERVPSIVVLDGLDEVGSISDRDRVVREINLFCARGKSYAVEPRVIVTTCPNSSRPCGTQSRHLRNHRAKSARPGAARRVFAQMV